MAERGASAPVRIREVRSPADRALGRAHRLLKRIFPRAELLPLRDWSETLREREAGLWTDLDWHLFVAEQGRRLVGAASGSYIGNVNVGLVLYFQPLDAHRRSIPADEVRRLVYTMWRRVYRIDRPLSRPLFRRMLRALPRGGRIASRPPETLGPPPRDAVPPRPRRPRAANPAGPSAAG